MAKIRFRDFSPVKTAAIGILTIVGLLVLTYLLPRMPFVRGTTYTAEFADGGQMKVTDYVRVAGTEVGEVTDMELAGDKVLVTFTAKGVRVTKDTQVAIKSATLLGARYLSVIPGNGEEIGSGDVIPLAQTIAPYNVSRSVEDVTAQIRDFDKPKLEAALNTFADALQDTPANLKATMVNVKALSRTIDTRDQALRELLQHANGVSKVLSDRTDHLRAILLDGNNLLAELQSRRELFGQLFRDLNYVTDQARKFVQENNEQLKPTLDELNEVLDIVERDKANLSLGVQRLSGTIGNLGEVISSGPAFSASLGLHEPGTIFNYTDALRAAQNPQAPRVPGNPGLPGGLGSVPNPLNSPPSGAGAERPNPVNPTHSGEQRSNVGGSGMPLLGGN